MVERMKGSNRLGSQGFFFLFLVPGLPYNPYDYDYVPLLIKGVKVFRQCVFFFLKAIDMAKVIQTCHLFIQILCGLIKNFQFRDS